MNAKVKLLAAAFAAALCLTTTRADSVCARDAMSASSSELCAVAPMEGGTATDAGQTVKPKRTRRVKAVKADDGTAKPTRTSRRRRSRKVAAAMPDATPTSNATSTPDTTPTPEATPMNEAMSPRAE